MKDGSRQHKVINMFISGVFIVAVVTVSVLVFL